MRNEDELMIALDIIKTYSEAAQLNGQQLTDAIDKIDKVRAELLKASQVQAKATVQSELAEPMAEFKKSTDKFWNDSAYLINTLKDQIDRNRWKHTMIFSMSAAVIFGMMILAVFIWLPSLDEIKQRRTSIEYLTPKVEDLRAKYNADFQTCGNKACVRVDLKQNCWSTQGSGVADLCILK